MAQLSNLTLRIIFGLLGAALVVTGVFYNEWTFLALFGGICTLTLVEFFNLLHKSGISVNRLFSTISGVILFVLHYLIQNNTLANKWYFAFVAFIFLIFIFELFQQNTNPFNRIANSFLGVIYIALPLALFAGTAFIQGAYNNALMMGILLLLWANDIGGYIAGMSFGKHKLYERISPKKTWEGSIGGAILCFLTAWVCAQYFVSIALTHWIAVAAIMVIFGSIGDLVESQFKRNLSVKDSGKLIPGHGGLLDRFDGLLIAAPFIAMYLKLFAS
jgi:phosphatidate cytidylyltransferase